MAESEEKLKSLLMRVKEQREKAGLKQYKKKTTKIMASGPITSLQIGEKWEQWQILFSWAPKITTDGDYSHEIKRCLLLEKKSYDPPRQHIKKLRHYFADKGQSSQSYGFPSSHAHVRVRP